MMSMSLLVLVCIWHAIIPQIAADWGLDLAHTSDVIVLVVLGFVFITMHVLFILWIRKRVRPYSAICNRSLLSYRYSYKVSCVRSG